MKIIHTADWHLGKLISNVFMTEEQTIILKALKKLIIEESADVLIVAGDVYDRSIPPVEAVNLLNTFLTEMIDEIGIKVILCSGNHDSSDRLAFGASFFESRGLYLIGQAEEGYQKVTLEDPMGNLTDFFILPYMTPFEGRKRFENAELKTNDDLYDYIFKKIEQESTEERHRVVVAHGFVVGMDQPEESDSERPLQIGGTDYISYRHFLPFDYTALGHLHNPQKVGVEHVRYSGSLLKYSFSESQHQKGAVIVDLNWADQRKVCDISFKALIPTRDMRIIKGPIQMLISEEVVSQGNCEDYIHAILTDRGELLDPILALRSVYPNILSLEKMSGQSESTSLADINRLRDRNPLSLFESFHEQIEGDALSEVEKTFVKQCIMAVFEEEA